VTVRRALLAATIAATIACGRSREVVSSQSTIAPTTPASADNNRTSHDDQTRVSGHVSDLAGTCPALTFTVFRTKVSTTSTTRFDRTGCSAVANGVAVNVEGTRQTDGSIQAALVEVNTHAR